MNVAGSIPAVMPLEEIAQTEHPGRFRSAAGQVKVELAGCMGAMSCRSKPVRFLTPEQPKLRSI